MRYGKIVGKTVCTIKYPGLEGVKLLIVQPLNKRLKPIGRLQVAADVNQAGIGDMCILTKSHEASMTLENSNVPIDLATVGIIDEFDFEKKVVIDKLHKGWNVFT